jgi:signal transduction histidine kinase
MIAADWTLVSPHKQTRIEARARRRPRLLIVDDDENIRSELVLLLAEEGFDCLACRTAEQAAGLMSNDIGIAVAIVDVRLPGASGLEFIAHARERDGTSLPTRFIVMSGHVDLDGAMQALRLKVDELLPKPIDPETLLQAIRRCLENVAVDALGRSVTATLAAEARNTQRPAATGREPPTAAARLLRLVSEELRLPLLPIIDASEQLMLATSPPPQSAQLGRGIRYEAVKLLERIDSIIDLLRITSGTVSPRPAIESPIRLIEAVMTNFEPVARPRGVRIDLDVSTAPAAVTVDRRMWLQAVAHVLRNAIEHSPRGSVVLIRVAWEQAELICEVTDSGPGMNSETMGKVQDAFRQGSEGIARSKGGLGLGLTLARQFLESQGGSLELRSNVDRAGNGTVVRLSIPMRTA